MEAGCLHLLWPRYSCLFVYIMFVGLDDVIPWVMGVTNEAPRSLVVFLQISEGCAHLPARKWSARLSDVQSFKYFSQSLLAVFMACLSNVALCCLVGVGWYCWAESHQTVWIIYASPAHPAVWSQFANTLTHNPCFSFFCSKSQWLWLIFISAWHFWFQSMCCVS